ncbi:MAG: hypothetical protein AAFU85_07010 [Planctomycetota bacterium]
MKRDPNTQADRRRFLGAAAIGASAAVSTQSVAEEATRRSLREVGRFSLGDASARRIASGVDASIWLLIGDRAEQRTFDGHHLGSIELPRPGRALASNSESLFIAIRNQVQQFSHSGELVRRLPRITGGLIGDIVVDGDRLVVTDLASGRLLRWTDDGWQRFGEPLRESSRISRGAEGSLLVADPQRHQVKMLSIDGTALSTWGRRARTPDGFQGCCNPMAITEVGVNELITVEAGQLRVKEFTKHGSLVAEVAGPENFETLATTENEDRQLACAAGGVDVALTPQGEVLLLHTAAREVIRYARA